MRKKETSVQDIAPIKTIDSLIIEFEALLSEYRERVQGIERQISECEDTINRLNEEINGNIATMTSEEYLAKRADLDTVTRTKEMHVQRLQAVRKSSTIVNDGEKEYFINALRSFNKAENESFNSEAMIHISALENLLHDRMESFNKSVGLAQRLGAYNALSPNNLMNIVSNTVNICRGNGYLS
jgi:hypothetical protein